jgi:hypothetical protein
VFHPDEVCRSLPIGLVLRGPKDLHRGALGQRGTRRWLPSDLPMRSDGLRVAIALGEQTRVVPVGSPM